MRLGRRLRLDTYNGLVDVTFLQVPETVSQMAERRTTRLIRERIKAAPWYSEEKTYAIYYEGPHDDAGGVAGGRGVAGWLQFAAVFSDSRGLDRPHYVVAWRDAADSPLWINPTVTVTPPTAELTALGATVGWAEKSCSAAASPMPPHGDDERIVCERVWESRAAAPPGLPRDNPHQHLEPETMQRGCRSLIRLCVLLAALPWPRGAVTVEPPLRRCRIRHVPQLWW